MRTIRDGIYSYRWTQVQEWYRVVKANTMAPLENPRSISIQTISKRHSKMEYMLFVLRVGVMQTQEMPFMKSLDFGFQRWRLNQKLINRAELCLTLAGKPSHDTTGLQITIKSSCLLWPLHSLLSMSCRPHSSSEALGSMNGRVNIERKRGQHVARCRLSTSQGTKMIWRMGKVW